MTATSRPSPLGATWDGSGTQFAVRSSADLVDLCIPRQDGSEDRRVLTRTGDVWHGYVDGAGPGTRYGFRAHGPYDPASGRWFDPSKLLCDPYAQGFSGRFAWDAEVFAQGSDTAGHVPWSVVVDGSYDWAGETRPVRDLADSVIYELHVRGFTKQLAGVPEELRGTYAGLAHPAAVEHLRRLGVTTVELLPVHRFVDEPHLQLAGLSNFWGYNSIGWFAPHEAYAAGPDAARELKDTVRALHDAGLHVLLDVVYNHTGEGDAAGPTLSFRGLDDALTYRRDGGYVDWTGCGNTVDLRQLATLQVVMDSLRHWVTEYHVDGFRFDLAVTLARGDDGFDARSTFLACVAQDPVLRDVILIAEPWDVGPSGYQLGGFPAPWGEWNGRFRDAVRDTWRGADLGVADLASRLTGSSDLFTSPLASVGFVTSHDGFALADLVSYDGKHNEANGEGNRDGTSDNRSWNGGVEGVTDDGAVLANRRSRRRAMLATLLLSTGVPMLRAGDELGDGQGGNNNAYCQDSPLSWLDWTGASDPAGHDPALVDLVSGLVSLRLEHAVFRRRTFFTGTGSPKDVGWFTAAGTEVTDWGSHSETLGVFLSGDPSFLLWLNACGTGTSVALPPWAASYAWVLDTARDDPWVSGPATDVALEPWSVVVLRAAADAP